MKLKLKTLENRKQLCQKDHTHFEDRPDKTYTLVLSEIDQLKREVFLMEETRKHIEELYRAYLKNTDIDDE
jgi:hypothetical protein